MFAVKDAGNGSDRCAEVDTGAAIDFGSGSGLQRAAQVNLEGQVVFTAAARNLGRRFAAVRTHRAEKKSVAHAVKSNGGFDVIVSGTPGGIEEKCPLHLPFVTNPNIIGLRAAVNLCRQLASGPIATLFVASMLMLSLPVPPL